jgi:hypothetical protein
MPNGTERQSKGVVDSRQLHRQATRPDATRMNTGKLSALI